MEVQNLRSLGMGWAWYVNDLSKYLPDADTLADKTPADDDAVGVAPDVPLSEIDLEPETTPVLDEVDPYVTSLPFPHAPPGLAETEWLGGMAPETFASFTGCRLGCVGCGHTSASAATRSFEELDPRGH